MGYKWTDDPVKADETEVKALHMEEVREAADDLDARLKQEIIDREAADAAEAQARAQADAVEAQARQNADAQEAQARQSGDSAEANAREAAMQQEIALRIAGDQKSASDISGAINTITTTITQQGAYIVSESIGSTGYRVWSDGFIEQWGIVPWVYNNSTNWISLPISFPNNNFGGQITWDRCVGNNAVELYGYTNSSICIGNPNGGGNGAKVWWRVTGN